jgi:hypothetical protein
MYRFMHIRTIAHNLFFLNSVLQILSTERLDDSTPLAYNIVMKLIETPVFRKQITRLLDETTYMQFKEYLVANPLKGRLIRGGGGIRKIRWGKKNIGKSGGVRIIYFINTGTEIYLLFAYSKNEADNLTKRQTNMLAKFVKGELL